MKIAIVTTDGETVSQHFGRSPYYKIYTIKDNDPVSVEMRQRGTGHFAQDQTNHEHHDTHQVDNSTGKHGYGTDADRKHATMAQEIGDCNILIAGGMGQGAYESFRQSGLEVILTNLQEINDVVNNYIQGTLENMASGRTD